MPRGGLAAALAALILLGGCGGRDEAATTAGATTEPAETTEPPVTTTTEPAETTEPPVTAPETTTTTTTETTETTESAFMIGAVDDAAREQGPKLEQLADAGFNAVGVSSYWEPGLAKPSASELAVLRDTAARAAERRLRVVVRIYHRGSATTPLTDAARAQFASYVAAVVRGVPAIRDVVVGNEPNLNRFWLPQFGAAGENVASAAYFALLARVYDEAKAAAADVRIWGGALAPRGVDRAGTGRDTQSPVRFLEGLGAAFERSGRVRPPLDGLAFHPYPESAAVAPDQPNPPGGLAVGLADHERLRSLLRAAFGRDLPILYSELGVETEIPPAKRSLYEGNEPAKPVDERTQADYYGRALELAACQEGVVGILLFHSHDEPALTGFQSGVYYVDGTPKASLAPVRDAIGAAKASAAQGC